eukprot:TRINITY_DN32077_c0_g1_i1.p1 TRINITY_DN32077_c0_g1~~TRINITY_DN32077_c0_g1_i1.p1  ORF type:complete len:199 (+),score=51.61 TRINITY_DN32077_c0_g1_i1:296-892(+)
MATMQALHGTLAPGSFHTAQQWGDLARSEDVMPISLASGLGLAEDDDEGSPAIPSGQQEAEEEITEFCVALVKANDCAPLGMNIASEMTPLGGDAAGRSVAGILVQGVSPGGAVASWNRHCSTSSNQWRRVLPGDLITSVNGISGNSAAMVEQFSAARLVRLSVRPGPHREEAEALVEEAKRTYGEDLISALADGLGQ